MERLIFENVTRSELSRFHLLQKSKKSFDVEVTIDGILSGQQKHIIFSFEYGKGVTIIQNGRSIKPTLANLGFLPKGQEVNPFLKMISLNEESLSSWNTLYCEINRVTTTSNVFATLFAKIHDVPIIEELAREDLGDILRLFVKNKMVYSGNLKNYFNLTKANRKILVSILKSPSDNLLVDRLEKIESVAYLHLSSLRRSIITYIEQTITENKEASLINEIIEFFKNLINTLDTAMKKSKFPVETSVLKEILEGESHFADTDNVFSLRQVKKDIPNFSISDWCQYMLSSDNALMVKLNPRCQASYNGSFYSYFKDYIEMALQVVRNDYTSIDLFPKDITVLHDVTMETHRLWLNKNKVSIEEFIAYDVKSRLPINIKTRILEEDYSKYVWEDDDSKFGIADDTYQIILPQTGNDLIEEGIKMSHCIGSYIDRVVKRSTKIVFLRNKKYPTKPLVTVEIAKNGDDTDTLAQIYGFHNSTFPSDSPEIAAMSRFAIAKGLTADRSHYRSFLGDKNNDYTKKLDKQYVPEKLDRKNRKTILTDSIHDETLLIRKVFGNINYEFVKAKRKIRGEEKFFPGERDIPNAILIKQ